jgi:4-amino-4-deoxy-L-arabinose transferase-like glycosyltransferase
MLLFFRQPITDAIPCTCKNFDELDSQPRIERVQSAAIPPCLYSGALRRAFFTFLGARDFWETETHYGEITRVMLQDGEYWVTRLNGEVWADSPPFYFWLTALVSRAWGRVDEWTVRLPSAFAATALVVAFYHFAQKWLGARAAFIATLVMSTAALTIHVERHIPINSTFYLWLTISMFLFMEVITAESAAPRRAYGAWFFLGLACLTKAPIGIVLPLSVIIAFVLMNGCGKKILWLRPISGPLLLLLVLSPWLFFALWKTSGHWVDYFFAQHHVLYNIRHREPWFYAAVFFPIGFVPWVFLLPPAVLSLWDGLNGRGEPKFLFLSIWWLAALVLAQLFDGHHNHYLFVAVVPAALVVGAFVDKLASGGAGARALSWAGVSLKAACVLLFVCGLAAPILAWRQLPDLKWHMVLFAVLLIAGAAWIAAALKQSNFLGVVARLGILLLIVDLQIQGLIFPAMNRMETRALAETLGAVAKIEDGVATYLTESSQSFFNFYSGIRRIDYVAAPENLPAYLSRPGAHFVLMKQHHFERLKKNPVANLQVISVHAPNAKGWFATSFPRWVLVYSCTRDCPPAPPLAEPSAALSDSGR